MSKRLIFPCKVKSSSVADKNGYTMVTTAISGKWYEGMMKSFNPALEDIFAGDDCWKGINADQGGTWKMEVSDALTGQVLGAIKPCNVKNINGTRIEDGMVMGLKLEHPLTPFQEALEKTILTDINVELTVDMTVFEDAPENDGGEDLTPPPVDNDNDEGLEVYKEPTDEDVSVDSFEPVSGTGTAEDPVTIVIPVSPAKDATEPPATGEV